MLCSKCQKNIEPNWFQCENCGNNFVNGSFEPKYKKAFEELCKEMFYSFDGKILFSYVDGYFAIGNMNYTEKTKTLIREVFKDNE